MQPIRKVRLSESVIDAIKEMISDNNLVPGDKLYSENELTRKLQVSRASIREAIRILEVTGVVTVKQGKGIYVADINEKKFEPFVSWLKSNEQSITDNFEVRLIIEPKAAACAAEKADVHDIEKMDEALVHFAANAENQNTAEIIKRDRDFHRFLAGATKNATLHILMKSMATSLPNGWISSLHTPGRIAKTIQEHKAILDAVKNRDAEGAERAMKIHLENALADIRSHMRGQLQKTSTSTETLV
jgi:GntR family transcriptional regulator, transcriptional repressor for pyruvate dehydrogenase complex